MERFDSRSSRCPVRDGEATGGGGRVVEQKRERGRRKKIFLRGRPRGTAPALASNGGPFEFSPSAPDKKQPQLGPPRALTGLSEARQRHHDRGRARKVLRGSARPRKKGKKNRGHPLDFSLSRPTREERRRRHRPEKRGAPPFLPVLSSPHEPLPPPQVLSSLQFEAACGRRVREAPWMGRWLHDTGE